MSSLLALLAAAAAPSPGLNLKYGGIAIGVMLMGIGLIRWSIRTYLETNGLTPVKGLRAPTMSPQFRVLQELGMATGEQLTEMAASDREQLFAAAMTQRLVAAKGANGAAGLPGLQPATPAPAGPVAGFRVSCSPDYLFCPACGATLGDRRTPLGYITSCLTCKRVLKARLLGERVTIESA